MALSFFIISNVFSVLFEKMYPIMFITIASSYSRFFTQRAYSSFRKPIMSLSIPRMFTITTNKLKVFNSIINLYSIYVMYDFAFEQISSHLLLHNKAMFEYITIPFSMRMIFFPKHNVSLMDYFPFPVMSIGTFRSDIRRLLNIMFMTKTRLFSLYRDITDFAIHLLIISSRKGVCHSLS